MMGGDGFSVCRDFGLESPLELGLRFAMAKSGVSTVLAGLSDESQLEDAIRWANRGPVSAEAVVRVLGLRTATV